MKDTLRLNCYKNRKVKRLNQLLILLSLLVLALGRIQAKEMVPIVVDNMPPYIDKQLETKGIITDIVSKSFASQKVDIELKFLPWMEAETLIDDNKHLSFMWGRNNEKDRKWLFSEAIYRSQVVIVSTKESRLYWDRVDQLRQYDLAIARGVSYGSVFDNYKPYLRLTETLSDYVNLKKLIARDVDGVVIERLQAEYLLSFFNPKQVNSLEFIAEPIVTSKPYFLVCSKSYSKCFDYINKFNRGFNLLKSQGYFQRVLENKEVFQ